MITDRLGRITFGHARFSFLGEGLVRIEHDREGVFDGRAALRALGKPKVLPFEKAEVFEGGLRLMAPGLEIDYADCQELKPESLSIKWKTGGKAGLYHYGDLDNENLGGIRTLDHMNVYQAGKTQGVHPGGTIAGVRSAELNMQTTKDNILDYYRAHAADFHFLSPLVWYVFKEYQKMPEDIQKELDIWRKWPSGPISRLGYWTLDEGATCRIGEDGWLAEDLRPGYVDLYFGCYGLDFSRAMKQFSAVLGQAPILPRWAYGSWYSRYYGYSFDEFREIASKHEERGFPLDVIIADMDWHKNSWCGWEWNEALIPDPKAFMAWKNREGIHVGLNLHDENFIRYDANFKKVAHDLGIETSSMEEKDESAEFEKLSQEMGLKIRQPKHSKEAYHLDYRDKRVWESMQKHCYGPNDELGVDFWWQDNWAGLCPKGNLMLWKSELMQRRQISQGRRPMALNRYAGLGSHRYPAYFSGDTVSQWEVLETEIMANGLAGNVNMSYFSHDLGGFVGELIAEDFGHISSELYVRWLQMGAIFPFMRIHSDHGIREPWNYSPNIEAAARKAYRLHHALVPYIYHLARENHDTGLPIIRPVYFEEPDREAAYSQPYEYFLGSRIFYSPVRERGGFHTVNFPAGNFWHYEEERCYSGPSSLEERFKLDTLPLYVRAGSIIPLNDYAPRVGAKLPDPLVLAIYPGGEDEIDFYEDDGTSPDYEKNFSRLKIRHHETKAASSISFDAIRGSFNGMPKTRNLRLEFHFVNRPKRISLKDANGRQEIQGEHDEKTRLLKVPVNGRSLESPFDLTVTFE